MAILWHATKQLALMAPASPVYKEHLAICDHKEVTIQLTYVLRAILLGLVFVFHLVIALHLVTVDDSLLTD